MGAYASNEAGNFGNIIAELCNPQMSDWIPAHAAALHTSPDVVAKLWANYERNFSTSAENEDKKRNCFFDYCINEFWNQNGDLQVQLKEALETICSSGKMSRNELETILEQLYAEESKQTIVCLTNLFYSQMNPSIPEYVTEDEIISWLKKLPPNVAKELLESCKK